jgi:hypothetical protein
MGIIKILSLCNKKVNKKRGWPGNPHSKNQPKSPLQEKVCAGWEASSENSHRSRGFYAVTATAKEE